MIAYQVCLSQSVSSLCLLYPSPLCASTMCFICLSPSLRSPISFFCSFLCFSSLKLSVRICSSPSHNGRSLFALCISSLAVPANHARCVSVCVSLRGSFLCLPLRLLSLSPALCLLSVSSALCLALYTAYVYRSLRRSDFTFLLGVLISVSNGDTGADYI